MPETVRITTSAVLNGTDRYPSLLELTGNSLERSTPEIGPAKVGQLTTRTDANTGVLTMASGHGFISTDEIDVFWSGGSRRSMTATVSVNAVTVDGGSGDDLPTNLTAITAMKPTDVPMVIDGDEIVFLGINCPKAGYAVFLDDQGMPAEIAAATFELGANDGYVWGEGNGVTNPLAGEITSAVRVSHGDSTAAREVKVTAVFN